MKRIIFIVGVLTLISCSVKFSGESQSSANSSKPNEEKSSFAQETNKKTEVAKNDSENQTSKQDCSKAKLADKTFIKNQSFAFDFEPFKDSCFVTFASTADMVDAKDVPRGSTFHIFRNGKEVYEFPDAFDGIQACWVEGVSFNDLNDDGLTEVIIAGSCLATKDSYPKNAVFINEGQSFTTNNDANAKLDNFTKLKDIEAFVRKNKNQFF